MTELLTLAQLSVVLYIMQLHVLEVIDMNISLLLVTSELIKITSNCGISGTTQYF